LTALFPEFYIARILVTDVRRRQRGVRSARAIWKT